MELVIGVVGKPSAGKSTLFNAVTEGSSKAKVGNFPFTTIEPNTGITYYRCACACKSRGKTAECKPRYGQCVKGERHIPIKLLDVAGLIPGASEGKGLGNKFLNDLRGAHVLMHIVDVSGTTNEKGEVAEGYDPINDIDWLDEEITTWVFNNLWSKWPGTQRRHIAAKNTAMQTFQAQLSGYGANSDMIHSLVQRMGIKEPNDIGTWGEDEVKELTRQFVDIRFPTIYVLNKADLGRHTDRNIGKITDKYDEARCIVTSAASECYLKKLRKQGYIRYPRGATCFTSLEDMDDEELAAEAALKAKFEANEAAATATPPTAATIAAVDKDSGTKKVKKKPGKKSTFKRKTKRTDYENLPLVPLDDRVRDKLDKIADMVIFRWGGTGVWAAIQAACDLRNPMVAYPVMSVTTYATEPDGGGVFGNAFMIPQGTSMKTLAHIVSHDIGRGFLYAEGEDGRRMGEDEVVTQGNCVMRFAFTRAVRPQNHTGSTGAGAGAGAGAGGIGAEGDGAGSKQRQKK